MKAAWLLLLILSAYFISVRCGNVGLAEQEEVVNTQNGPVKGLVTDTNRGFFGIPFAQPPIGVNRWTLPQPAAKWGPATLDATKFKPGCYQQCKLPPAACPPDMSEDCLYLNVFTPRLNVSSPRWPVLVFLHGGAFLMGAASTYNPQFFVNRTSTIVVTTNYRLGAFGFLVTSLLGGNFGLYDQRLAMQWVVDNINAFGGDVNNITLYGQSAGAMSVAIHLTSPLTPRPLRWFHRGIMESNPFSLQYMTIERGGEVGRAFSKHLGCDFGNLQCMLEKTSEEVLIAQKKTYAIFDPPINPFNFTLSVVLTWAPVIDGKNFLRNPIDSIAQRAPEVLSMPLLLGTTLNESRFFVFQALHENLTRVEYEVLLDTVFRGVGKKVLAMYPPTSRDTRETLSHLLTDYLFVCPTRYVGWLYANSIKDNSVYSYHFTRISSFNEDLFGPKFNFCDNAVCHGAELSYVFNWVPPPGQFNPQEEQLSLNIIRYWTNFASTGNPNTNKTVQVLWPALNSNTDSNIVLDVPISVQTHLNYEYCNIWDQFGYHF